MNSISKILKTGDGREVTVTDIANIYRDTHSRSVPSHGYIHRVSNDTYSIKNYFKALDCDILETKTTFKNYFIKIKSDSANGNSIAHVGCLSEHEEVTELLSSRSENGRYWARLKASKNDREKNQHLEIWSRSQHIKTIDISDLEEHGSIVASPTFSSFMWSRFGEQDKLLYVCQRKRPKHVSFFKDGPLDEKERRGEEFVRRKDWGECLEGIEHTIIAILDVSNNFKISTIDVDGHSLANPQWMDNGTKIVSSAYHEGTNKLGIIFCNNKKCKIMIHDLNNELILELESDDCSYHSPRVTNSGEKFIYVSNSHSTVHLSSQKLKYFDLNLRTDKILEIESKSNKLGELFIECLPTNCFTKDDKRILFITSDHLCRHMNLYDLDLSKLTELQFPTKGMSIFDFQHDIILASGSEFNATPTIFVAILGAKPDDIVAWHQLEDCIHLNELDYESHELPTSDGSSFISAILITSNLQILQKRYANQTYTDRVTDSNRLPTVLVAHGGPHSAFLMGYVSKLPLYTSLGLNVLYVNYRGSTGVDQKYLESLIGCAGKLDVDDCLQVIRHFVHSDRIDASKLIIEGGSHSGFITAHLLCQNEFKFLSAVIRNPVIDMWCGHQTSDIPEWYVSVGLGYKQYEQSWIPSEEEFLKLYRCSPMFRASLARIPTLMLLGSEDKRVNMAQGLKWIENLEARGVETLCKVYPDRHALDKDKTHGDQCVTSAHWILKHLP